MGPRAFNRVCASIRINRDYDVVSVRINAHGVTKRAWAFNCETTVLKFEKKLKEKSKNNIPKHQVCNIIMMTSKISHKILPLIYPHFPLVNLFWGGCALS